MRGKKAKALRKVIKNQISKMAVGTERDLNQTVYEEPKKFAKQHLVLRNGKTEQIALVYTKPIVMEFCFRRAYQSLKQVVKQTGKLKDVRA